MAHSALPGKSLSSHVAHTSDTDGSQTSQTSAEMKESFLWSLINTGQETVTAQICLCMSMEGLHENPK